MYHLQQFHSCVSVLFFFILLPLHHPFLGLFSHSQVYIIKWLRQAESVCVCVGACDLQVHMMVMSHDIFFWATCERTNARCVPILFEWFGMFPFIKWSCATTLSFNRKSRIFLYIVNVFYKCISDNTNNDRKHFCLYENAYMYSVPFCMCKVWIDRGRLYLMMDQNGTEWRRKKSIN